jgi:hypothetical protein
VAAQRPNEPKKHFYARSASSIFSRAALYHRVGAQGGVHDHCAVPLATAIAVILKKAVSPRERTSSPDARQRTASPSEPGSQTQRLRSDLRPNKVRAEQNTGCSKAKHPRQRRALKRALLRLQVTEG